MVNPQDKIEQVLHEFKTGTLRSGSANGPKVTDPKQAQAIAINVSRRKAMASRAKKGY